MMALLRKTVIKFEDGPYLQFDFGGSNSSFASLSNIINSFYFESFTLRNRGISRSDNSTGYSLYATYQNFAQSRGHTAERVSGFIQGELSTLVGNLMIKTPKTGGQYVRCTVAGTSRNHYYFRATGTYSIFIVFDDVIIKRPFKYVDNIAWKESNWPVAMHYNYDIDPACPVGFTNDERYLVETAMDGILIESMRLLIVKRLRQMYVEEYIEPYRKYIEGRNW